jgi:hypothetical protein
VEVLVLVRKIGDNEQLLLGLIRRYDTKMATHIGVIIAITFGLFSILPFLRGAGLPPKTMSGWVFWVIEMFLIVPILSCVVRAMHYSAMAENLKRKSQTLRKLEEEAFNGACAYIPMLLRWMIEWHRGRKLRIIKLSSAPITVGVWLFVVLPSVLMLPL